MKRSRTFIIAALAVGLGLFWAYRMFEVGDEHETANQLGRSGEQERRASQPPPQRQGQSEQTKGDRRSVGTQPEPQLKDQQQFHADRAPIAQPGVQPQPRPQAQPPDNGQAPGVDFSVVGHPFPVSESILTACGPKPAPGPSSWCERNRKFLDEMAEEPREEPWATAAEGAIRALVELEPGTERPRTVTYTVRALECRTSICFVETASVMGWFSTELYRFEKTSGLTAQYAIHSAETDAYGTNVYVTLWPFERGQAQLWQR